MKAFYILFLFAACLLVSEGTYVKIVNGHEAKRNSRPYMAYIRIQNQTHQIFCGGSLIKSNWVVTAAHCRLSRSKARHVILGSHLSDPKAQERGRQFFFVKRSIIHPNYEESTLNHDIQLIQLSRPARLGCQVQRLPLPNTYQDVEAGTVCETAGWGQTETERAADVLMEVNVTTINRYECQKRFNNGEEIVTENKICTTVGFRGENVCQGDSGGPLICEGVFRGIVSFGVLPCDYPNGAAAYTRLTEEHVYWIQRITGE